MSRDSLFFEHELHVPGLADLVHEPEHRDAVFGAEDVAVRQSGPHAPGDLPDFVLEAVHVGRAFHCVRLAADRLDSHRKGAQKIGQIHRSLVKIQRPLSVNLHPDGLQRVGSASPAFVVKGFSQRTCLPALRQRSAFSKCSLLGVAM